MNHSARDLVRIILLASITLSVRSEPVRGQCSPSGLSDGPLEVTNMGTDFDVHYVDGMCLAGSDNFTDTLAQDALDAADMSLDLYRSFSFREPHQSTLPDFDVYIYDIGGGGGAAYHDCITIEAPRYCSDGDDQGTRQVTQHELFHAIQRAYMCDVTDCDSGFLGSTFGKWVSEGTARYTDDRLYDDLDSSTAGISFRNEIMTTFNSPTTSLLDHSYRACLFWSYCSEQLGSVMTEPQIGIDFMRRFWDRIAANGTTDSLQALRDTLTSLGTDLDTVWLDYAIANYAREFDVSSLNNPQRYLFVDEQQAVAQGEGPYPNVSLNNVGIPTSASTFVDEYAFRVFEADVDSANECSVVGFRGESEETLGWAVAGVTRDDRMTSLSRGMGTDFGRSIIVSFTDPIDRIAAVATGLDEGDTFDYEFGAGQPRISIFRPTFTRQAYPGPADNPGRFLARIFVEGPDELKPEGVGQRSILGLQADDFTAQVGGIDADIITASYVGGEYWLVIQAPVQPADGLYTLRVGLCDGAVTASREAVVLYADLTINHMLVIDVSGSMGQPSGDTKLDAARIAAGLYVDSVSDNDRVGVVAFSGDGSDCSGDIVEKEALDTATSGQRNDAKMLIGGLSPASLTSIGDGLWEAQNELDGFALATDLHTMVLLSDGAENEARWWDNPIPCPSAAGRIVPGDTIVNAIAFGPESDQPLMQDIATSTEGDYSYVDVSLAATTAGAGPMTNDLADSYMNGLQTARGLERLFFDEGSVDEDGLSFTIPVTEGKVTQATFFFSIDALGGGLDVELVDPSGNPPAGTIYKSDEHIVYHVPGTLAEGEWRVNMRSGVPTRFIAGLLGRLRLGTQCLLEVAQVNTGGLINEPEEGRFERGVPVTILALLTDAKGAIRDARVEAVVTKPDGRTGCARLVLRDDGLHHDGQANDGVYAALFTETAQGSRGGVDNDREPGARPSRGSYQVEVRIRGTNNGRERFNRRKRTSFTVFDSGRDRDQDNLPDTWEVYYGTNPSKPDAEFNPDNDLLTNKEELQFGTDPFDDDTDNDGELDGSEARGGRCPVDAADKALAAPVDVEVVDDLGDEGNDLLDPRANLLRFPSNPNYDRLRIYRAVDAPLNLQPVKELEPREIKRGWYQDFDIQRGRTYYYQLQALGAPRSSAAKGAVAGVDVTTRRSRIVSGVAPTIDGDFNLSGRVDLRDAAIFQRCFTKVNGGIQPGCDLTDLDGDAVDTDLADYAGFRPLVLGPE